MNLNVTKVLVQHCTLSTILKEMLFEADTYMKHDRSKTRRELSIFYSLSAMSILTKIHSEARWRCTGGQTYHGIHGLHRRQVSFDSFRREKLTLSKAEDFYIKPFNHNTVFGIERGRTTTRLQLIWAKRQVFSFAGVSIHA